MKTNFLVVGFSLERLEGCLAGLARLQQIVSANPVSTRIYWVQNQNPNQRAHLDQIKNTLQGLSSEVEVVSGSNRILDHSGYHEGLQGLLKSGLQGQEFLFVLNDTFFDRGYFSKPSLFATQMMIQNQWSRTLIGHQDHFKKPLSFFGRPLYRWLRSNFLFGKADSLLPLWPLPEVVFTPEFLLLEKGRWVCPSGLLSQEYLDFMDFWLLGRPHSDYQEKWYLAGQVDSEFLVKKAKSIVCEHWLSQKALGLGFEFVP